MSTPKYSDIVDKMSYFDDDKLDSLIAVMPSEVSQARELKADRLAKSDVLKYHLSRFITQNASMLELKRRVEIVAHTDDPVLITGPTGTGKEIIAQALHGHRVGRFIDVNCAGLPEHLIESELFGHVKGSFTDAKTDKQGMLVAADGGTIFLDEIGDMPLGVQAKLLRALQEHQIRPVGATQSVEINCRFIAATHQNLVSLVSDRKFREDLYWRLSVVELETLELTKRIGDIPLIVKALDLEHKIGDYPKFCRCIKAEDLAGNVRSLQRIIRRFYLFNEVPS